MANSDESLRNVASPGALQAVLGGKNFTIFYYNTLSTPLPWVVCLRKV